MPVDESLATLFRQGRGVPAKDSIHGDLRTTNEMIDALPAKAEWHRWDLPKGIGWWIAATGYLMGAVGFLALFFPSLAKFPLLLLITVLFVPVSPPSKFGGNLD